MGLAVNTIIYFGGFEDLKVGYDTEKEWKPLFYGEKPVRYPRSLELYFLISLSLTILATENGERYSSVLLFWPLLSSSR